MTDIRQDPAYIAAFENAKVGEPLFDTASPAYAAGWKAYWEMSEVSDPRFCDGCGHLHRNCVCD